MAPELYAAGRVIGNKCFDQNLDWLKCKQAKGEGPSACATEGEAVHKATVEQLAVAQKKLEEFEASDANKTRRIGELSDALKEVTENSAKMQAQLEAALMRVRSVMDATLRERHRLLIALGAATPLPTTAPPAYQ